MTTAADYDNKNVTYEILKKFEADDAVCGWILDRVGGVGTSSALGRSGPPTENKLIALSKLNLRFADIDLDLLIFLAGVEEAKDMLRKQTPAEGRLFCIKRILGEH